MKTIPEDFTKFLYWVKEKTEKYWSQETNREEWSYNAKWIGLTDEQINEVEKKYSVQFTPEHRAFLKILHTLDRKEKYEYLDEEELIIEENSFFYNWIEDDQEIKRKLTWPFDEILRDIFSEMNRPFWLDSCGKRPGSKEETIKLFTEAYQKSPQLIPIKSHRFVVSDTILKHRPILSIWGTDTIVYGWTLRTYILNEIGQQYLGTTELIYDEEDQQFYPELTAEAKKIHENDYKYDSSKKIPFWEEIILSYNTGWSSFGLESSPTPYIEPLKKSVDNQN